MPEYGREGCGVRGPLGTGSPLGRSYFFPIVRMHLLYIDGSGSVKNPNEEYFILGGISVFERQIFHLIKRFDDFVDTLNLGPAEEIELHASEIASGRKKPWKGLPRKKRLDLIEDALEVLRNELSNNSCLFAVAVQKSHRAPYDPVEYAFEEVCNRFNLKLSRMFNRSARRPEDRNRGLVIMDKSDNYESALQNLARKFRMQGTRWGDLRNMAEVPLFVDSQASRIVQLADLVAWSVWRRYEFQDTRYFDKIASKFDAEGGVIHGLVHDHSNSSECTCPACLSRTIRSKH